MVCCMKGMFKSSHRRCSLKNGVLKKFAKSIGKNLCQSLFFNKVAGLTCIFIKKETLAQVTSCEFCEIFKNTFLIEHLGRLLLNISKHYVINNSFNPANIDMFKASSRNTVHIISKVNISYIFLVFLLLTSNR